MVYDKCVKAPPVSDETVTREEERNGGRVTSQRRYANAKNGPRVEVSHGIIGVVYTMLRSIQVVKALQQNDNLMNAIVSTLEYLIDLLN